ncbi:phytase [Luteimonas sp. SJ-92]|uniref:Phytase n=1 Tax=Luteimonas salinisoli TaxID=2752307 RepID=A0A853JE95_9GAMM|nr:phytase [Luteimonas salinisoli]NZA26880.1 phytase [Luteimonas salinisoli]
MTYRLPALAGLLVALAACTPGQRQAPAAPAALTAQAQTRGTAGGEVESGVLVVDAADPAAARVVGAAAMGGLELYALDGRRLTAAPAGEAVAVDVAYDVPLGDARATVLAAIDALGHRLRFFRLEGDTLSEVGARPLALGFAAEGVCLLRSRLDGSLHAFVVGDGGEIDHHLLFGTAEGKVDARQVRRIHLPSPLKQCVADPVASTVYVAEEAVGIWRFSADAEADVAAVLVDSPRLGGLEEEVGGLAIHDGGDGARWLLASDASAGRINVYDIERDEAFVGAFTVAPADGPGAAIEEPGPLYAAGAGLGTGLPHGALLVTDGDGGDFKLLSIADVAGAFGLDPGTGQDPRQRPRPETVTVTALVETAPVASYGDAADDPAIWAHPTQPEKSLVIATDKKAGLYVYDMRGEVLQFLPDGKMNNVDLRDGFELGGERVTLVAASDRTRKAIALYRLDPEAGTLVDVADGLQPTGMQDPYGLCMYRSPRDGATYVFVNGDDTAKKQWRLLDAGGGRVRTQLVRELAFDSQTEGCVADDAAATLYVGEEDVALWRLSAEPDGGDEKTAIDRIDANPAIVDDLEGASLYDLGDGRGYLVVSSQGDDTYAVYRREEPQEYLGSFAVVADPELGIDGISETDGLDVSSRNLGPGFAHGAMVAQDGRNAMPVENQNYKYVPWRAIAEALGLEVRGE